MLPRLCAWSSLMPLSAYSFSKKKINGRIQSLETEAGAFTGRASPVSLVLSMLRGCGLADLYRSYQDLHAITERLYTEPS